MTRRSASLLCVLALLCGSGLSRTSPKPRRSLDEYLRSLPNTSVAPNAATLGSLWVPGSPMTELAADYKARHVNDLVIVRIVEDTSAASSGSVATERNFSANSGVSALAGQLSTSNIESLFSPHSAAKLAGQGQTQSSSMLRTSLAGQVVSALPSGLLVVQAQRDVTVNNERQIVIIRGLVRPGDIAADGSIQSTSMSNLEIELLGKGVISDGTRPPNVVVRLLLKILGF